MMRRPLLLSLLAIAAVAVNAFAIEGRLAGKITDAVTKKPIPDVTILVVSTGGRTFKEQFKGQKDGSYQLLVLDATLPYDVTFSAPGYQSEVTGIKMKLGEVTNHDVELNPAAASAAAPEAKPDPAVAAYNDGAAAFNAGDFTTAASKFEQAVAAKPELTAAWEALARADLRLKNYPRAIEAANKALAVDPDEKDLYSVLYESYTATGDTAKAAEAKKNMPADATSLFNDAAKLINAGNDAKAEPLLKQAISIDDKFARAYYELGMLYVRTQKNADARANLQKFIELDPTSKDAATAKEVLNYLK